MTLGFSRKASRERYEYRKTERSSDPAEPLGGRGAASERFLQQHSLPRLRACRKSSVRPATDDEATDALVKAGTALKSSLGYSPITDVGLSASVRLLTENSVVLELSRTTELLKRLQKRIPDFVRFTVDRMGAMAHVKFLKALPGAET